MKWRKETKVYMFADYYSEDGKWKAWDETEVVKGGSKKRYYDAEEKKFKNEDLLKHYWKLENIKTGEVIDKEFKTLKAAKEFAESPI